MSESLLDSYDAHPLNARAIRLRIDRRLRRPPTELDLALDPETQITDQNHIGGLATVIQVADLARVSQSTRVCDIGGGLGGPARALALLFGCHVHMLDIHAQRCDDARELTALVGLEQYVTIQCADAAQVHVTPGRYDLLWGQSAWIQFDDLSEVLTRWWPALSPGGQAVCEDAVLTRGPDPLETPLLADLEAVWHCRIRPRTDWDTEFQRARFTVDAFHDLSFLVVPHFEALSRSQMEAGDREREGWSLALTLAGAGVLGYGRWLARRRP